MVELNAATLLAGWVGGGWLCLWVTTRRREVGLGYGWLMRPIFLLLAAGSVTLGGTSGWDWSQDWASALRDIIVAACFLSGVVALIVSLQRRSAGVSLQRVEQQRRSDRVAAMTGIDKSETSFDFDTPEFPPLLDLCTALLGLVATTLGAFAAEGPTGLALGRTLTGALFVGAVSSAMLLGHWYLVQPGLARGPLLEMLRAALWLWLPHTLIMLVPTGMFSVLNGSIDDGYNGLLGWFWAASAVMTVVLVIVARAALRERQYSAVMAATGLVYLAIVTAFGQDLVARILLAP